MSFPLFRRPGTIVLVDDDEHFLEQLKLLLPADLNVRLFLSPRDVIPVVLENAKVYAEDAAKQQAILARRAEQRVLDGILDYWSQTPDRFGVIQTVVSDYFMPAMNGLEMLSRLGGWTGRRILLTGQADEAIAVKAFNSGLINRYITKGTPDLTQQVIRAVREANLQAHPRYEHIWRSGLTAEQGELLQDVDVARDLTSFADGHWAEYMVLGEPFGVFGMSASGRPGWLQLEPAESLALAADIALDAGASAADAEGIRAGRLLAASEVGPFDPERMTAPAVKFGGPRAVYGAFFELWPPAAAGGYAQWLPRQAARRIA